MKDQMLRILPDAANNDGEFQIAARMWDAEVVFVCGDDAVAFTMRDGRMSDVRPVPATTAATIRVSGPPDGWAKMLAAVPSPFYHDLFGASVHHGFTLEGTPEDVSPYYPALRRLVELLRASGTEISPAARAFSPRPAPRFDNAVGRYIHLDIDGVDHRVYFEERGEGIPLVLQHTAGADGRQWRHVLEDGALAQRYRMIAYDLPYHGKSLPPEGTDWWTREYRLTKDFLMQVPRTLSRELGLDRPVFMGSSIGGHLAIDLALHHPEDFRAVIGIEASAATPGGYQSIWYHPRIANDFKASVMYGLMSPSSPEALRRETSWVYSQRAPPTFKGDLYYYSVDHDLTKTAERIDTSKCAVYILCGEYDWSSTPAMARALADRIKGAQYRDMPGLGHFPMSENPALFLEYIRPVLDDIGPA